MRGSIRGHGEVRTIAESTADDRVTDGEQPAVAEVRGQTEEGRNRRRDRQVVPPSGVAERPDVSNHIGPTNLTGRPDVNRPTVDLGGW